MKNVVPIVRQNRNRNRKSPLNKSLSTAMLSQPVVLVLVVFVVLVLIMECLKARQERKLAKIAFKRQMRMRMIAHLLYCITMYTLIIGWWRIFFFFLLKTLFDVTLERLRSLTGLVSKRIIRFSK